MYEQFSHLGALTGHSSIFEKSEVLPNRTLSKEEVKKKITECYIEYAFGMGRTANVEQLKFLTISAPPHIFVRQQPKSFEVYGPIFSIYFEVAKKLKYNMTGLAAEASNELGTGFACYRPDMITTVLWPHLTSVAEMVIYDTAKTKDLAMLGLPPAATLTKSLGVISADHVAQFAEPNTKTWYSFLTVFSTGIWLAILVCFLVFGFLNSFFTKSLNKSSLLNHLWLLFRSLLNEPYIRTGKLNEFASQVAFCFELLSFLLQQYLGGGMVSEFARNAGWITLDSWDDLVGTNIDIFAINPDVLERPELEEKMKNDYFRNGTVYQNDFTKRLKLVPISAVSHESFEQYFISILAKVGKEKACFLVGQAGLKLGQRKFRETKDSKEINYHISKKGGDIQPNFLMMTHFASKLKKTTTDLVIVAFREFGIYDMWLERAIFGYRSDVEEEESIGYKNLSLQSMSGAWYITILGYFASANSLIVEMYFNRNNRLFIRPNQIDRRRSMLLNNRYWYC